MLLLNLHFFEPNDSILLIDLQRLLLSIKRYHYSSSGDQQRRPSVRHRPPVSDVGLQGVVVFLMPPGQSPNPLRGWSLSPWVQRNWGDRQGDHEGKLCFLAHPEVPGAGNRARRSRRVRLPPARFVGHSLASQDKLKTCNKYEILMFSWEHVYNCALGVYASS